MRLVRARDEDRCCITKRSRASWDILGWSQPDVVEIVPSSLVQCLRDEVSVGCSYIFSSENIFLIKSKSSLRQILSTFLSEVLLQSIILCLDINANHNGQLKNLWTLDKQAAVAFKSGHIYLEPDSLDPDDDCQKISYVCNLTS